MFTKIKRFLPPIIIFLIFEITAVVLWLVLDNIFYLFNFTYIGFFVSLGIGLLIAKYKNARIFIQFFIGLYMLVYLGIIRRENMQIEGFFYYMAIGVFEAAAIHYLVAKTVGPFIFGRGWCGYACWTTMILDLLPYKIPQKQPVKKLGLVRIAVFALSLTYFFIIFIRYRENIEKIMYISFIAGNIIYYSIGILFAYLFKDNRAFCKYFCPITVFLKPACYFALSRRKVKQEKCISCNKCKLICPMNVDMLDNRLSRKNGTECIQCMKCVIECPQQALS
jgi:ferredoxin-type protein NapH